MLRWVLLLRRRPVVLLPLRLLLHLLLHLLLPQCLCIRLLLLTPHTPMASWGLWDVSVPMEWSLLGLGLG